MMIERGRVRWHCRRGLLELDLVFTRFLAEYFDHLNDDQLTDLVDLLLCEDNDLWDMVCGRKECEVERWKELIGMLRHSGAALNPTGS
jgi:antitoxin CptB